MLQGGALRRWISLLGLWFSGDERWKARGYASAVVLLALLNTLFSVRISYAQRNFSTAMSGKDVVAFYQAVADFVVIICIAAPFFSFTGFVEDRLVLAWRAYLTRFFLTAYFRNQAYFRIRQQSEAPASSSQLASSLQDAASPPGLLPGKQHAQHIDNPDQRICDDIAAFVRSSTSITLSLCKKVFNCVAFAGVLWGVSGSLVGFMFVYAIVGTLATTSLFGRVMMRLYHQMLAREGDMRYSLVRMRENAESIAFYKGEAAEATVVHSRLRAVVTTALQRIRWAGLYDLWTSVYNYATILAPSLLTAPRYFRGEIEFGVISQASFAFSSIESALSIIINNLGQLTGLAAETDRLDALLQALTQEHDEVTHQGTDSTLARLYCSSGGLQPSALQAARITRHVKAEQEGLLLRQLSVAVPGSARLICSDLDLQLSPGESLLVVGPSGCGKSSLLRALAGLWREGAGSIHLPAATFFLPQKPFMALGSLRQNLLFPAEVPETPSHSTSSVASIGFSPASSKAVAGAGSIKHRTHAAASHMEMTHKGVVTPGSAHVSPVSDHEESLPLLSRSDTLSKAGQASPTATRIHVLPGSGSVSLWQDADSHGPGNGAGASPGDAELLRLLGAMRMEGVADKVGGLDATRDWTHELSSGEQQRVAFVRLLLNCPHLAFLDEATSALDQESEAIMYKLLRASRIDCFVSVGHRLQLLKYHTHVLECKLTSTGPTWTKMSSTQFQTQLAAMTGLSL